MSPKQNDMMLRIIRCKIYILNIFFNIPVLMKYGIRNLPDKTLSLNECNVLPSNGRAPHTNTYKTTPMLCKYIDKMKTTAINYYHSIIKINNYPLPKKIT